MGCGSSRALTMAPLTAPMRVQYYTATPTAYAATNVAVYTNPGPSQNAQPYPPAYAPPEAVQPPVRQASTVSSASGVPAVPTALTNAITGDMLQQYVAVHQAIAQLEGGDLYTQLQTNIDATAASVQQASAFVTNVLTFYSRA